MRPDRSGLVIGAVFGLTYVVVNARALPLPAGPVLQVLGVVAVVGVVVGLRRPVKPPAADRVTRGGFGRGYWLVVAAELATAATGSLLLNGPLNLPEGVLPWISFVVGVHFLGFARVWGESSLGWLGAGIAVLGALGLGVASVGASNAAIASVAGVGPGVLLLLGGLWGAAQQGQ